MCDVLCWITQLKSYSTHTQTLRYFGFFFSMHIYKVELHSDALRLCFVSFCFVSRFVEGTSLLCTIVRAKRHVHIERKEEEEQQHIESEHTFTNSSIIET